MTWFMLTVSARFYWNRVKDWVRSNMKWILTGLIAAGTLAFVYFKRDSFKRTTAAETAAQQARRSLDILELGYRHAAERSDALNRKDKALEDEALRLAKEIEMHKAAIVELETNRVIDWDSLSDEEIDARFKAAGL